MTRFLTALGNEIRKGLAFAWSERLQILLELPFFALFILLLGPLLGASHQIASGHLSWRLGPPPSHRTLGHRRPGLAAHHHRRLPRRRHHRLPPRRTRRQDSRHTHPLLTSQTPGRRSDRVTYVR